MTFVKRRPISFFLAAAIVITYVGGIAVFLLVQEIQQHSGIDLRWAGEFVLKFGPTLAAILTMSLSTGSRGIRDLVRRCAQWRSSFRLYAAAILLQPAILAIVLIIQGHGQQLQSITFEAAIAAFAVQLALSVFLGGGLGEEPGWRGFMLPRLLERHGPLAASLLVTVAWFAWHVPAFILFDKGASDPILPFAVILLPFSIILTYLCLRSNQGLVLPILLHGSVNASYYTMEALLPEVTGAPDFQPAFDWWLAGIWCVLGAIVAWRPVSTTGVDR